MFVKQKIFRLSFLLSVPFLFSEPSALMAEEVCKNIALEQAQKDEFSKMQFWLDHLEAEKGSFSQIDQNGKNTTGSFALQRPDKMRFDYDGKTGIHIIGNEGKLAYTDPSVGQVTFIPMDKTPLGLLFGKTYGWSGICLQKFTEANNLAEATLAQANNPSQGNITLKFSKDPFQLLGWRVEDMQGGITEISLEKIKAMKHFSKNYFQLPTE
ncbi:outer membrane lipoprotein carrier protein LolA [Acetobacteraceae bacterium]|nr:outer membrane lipoprotein carrier protein LolA [Acetobacteraceae bacterium]